MKIKCFIISLLLLMTQPVWSIDLYQAQVVVTDTAEEHRLPALKQVLKQVLVKLTGVHNIDLNTDELNHIEKWVQQFTYKSETGLVWLEVIFNREEINTLLEKLGLEVWQQPRATILAWVAHKDEIINDVQQVNRMQVLKAIAAKHGIEMIFPILDLYERRNFPLKQITAYQMEDIKSLAQRYTVDTVLIGHIESENEQQANWQLFYNNKQSNWKTQHKQLNNLLISGVEQAVNRVAPQSVQNINAKTEMEKKAGKTITSETKQAIANTHLNLTITGVPNLTIYAKINKYLKALPEVKNIEMKNMSSNQLLFEITAKATPEQFVKILQASKMLIIQSQTENNISGKFQENI
ncbi:DUF2066 domain-containing protein [Candidatus Albibeggiatoa sp. nov. BB20]|uniref:DUF2066 domain-containing protein n=1 Tax=Candidatus Albibeggiatoa sp. nov. BB20 TaxID=3162723 RepID=UPI003365A97E